MDQRQQAIIDCATIAWKRMQDTFQAWTLMEGADHQTMEAMIIFERIKLLDETIDWEALGLMMSDDPRRKQVV